MENTTRPVNDLETCYQCGRLIEDGEWCHHCIDRPVPETLTVLNRSAIYVTPILNGYRYRFNVRFSNQTIREYTGTRPTHNEAMNAGIRELQRLIEKGIPA